MVSVRSLCAAQRASITHCAADVIIGDLGGTVSNPAKQNKPTLVPEEHHNRTKPNNNEKQNAKQTLRLQQHRHK